MSIPSGFPDPWAQRKRSRITETLKSRDDAKVDLETGSKPLAMPLVGLGCWKAEKNVVATAVKNAIKAGYRHIDSAAIYGNEAEIGEALKSLFDDGVIKREELFITSKLWCTEFGNVEAACKQTIADLQCSYLDLYLIHKPVSFEKQYTGNKIKKGSPHDENDELILGKVPLHKVWHDMEGLVEKGLTKTIGVSNFPVLQLADLLTYAKIRPAVQQIEISAYFSNLRNAGFCAKQGIHVTAFSPLGSGRSGPLQDPVINRIAKSKGVTPAQVLLRWALQHGFSVIPKSTNAGRIAQNLDLFSYNLTDAEMDELDGLNTNQRNCHHEEFHNIPWYD